MARPTKLTPERKEKILKAVKMGLPYETSAKLAGIGETTFWRWMAKGNQSKTGKYREFWKEIKEAESIAEAKLLQDIQKDPSWQSKAWILERRFRDTYSTKQEINHSGNIDNKLIVEIVKNENTSA